jgi:hypothetical protein
MREIRYDVVPHGSGYAIMITPGHAGAFAAKHDAFDAAIELARKLRFIGVSVHVRLDQNGAEESVPRAKAS